MSQTQATSSAPAAPPAGGGTRPAAQAGQAKPATSGDSQPIDPAAQRTADRATGNYERGNMAEGDKSLKKLASKLPGINIETLLREVLASRHAAAELLLHNSAGILKDKKDTQDSYTKSSNDLKAVASEKEKPEDKLKLPKGFPVYQHIEYTKASGPDGEPGQVPAWLQKVADEHRGGKPIKDIEVSRSNLTSLSEQYANSATGMGSGIDQTTTMIDQATNQKNQSIEMMSKLQKDDNNTLSQIIANM